MSNIESFRTPKVFGVPKMNQVEKFGNAIKSERHDLSLERSPDRGFLLKILI